MSDLETLKRTLPMVGAEPEILDDVQIPHVVAIGHNLLSQRSTPGLNVWVEGTRDAIVGKMVIEKGVRIANPVHMCFGLVHPAGSQHIKIDVTVKEHASAAVLAHCLFPYAEAAEHTMEATVALEEGASLTYTEGHYHGPYGGMKVYPKATVKVGTGARYFADFSLLRGHVGRLAIEYAVEVDQGGVVELTAKVFGRGTDDIRIKESASLRGEQSRGLIKTRVVLEDDACAEVTGITEAYAKGARGHVDCKEIVKDRATANAIPIVRVFHPLAKVTHEAAIGQVDQKELETLMARGLTPEEAVEVIVSGILR